MPGQLQTKDIGDVKCLLRTIVIPSHVLKKKTEREKKCRPVEFTLLGLGSEWQKDQAQLLTMASYSKE